MFVTPLGYLTVALLLIQIKRSSSILNFLLNNLR